MVVPGGCTGVCQPLDVLIMKPFKILYAKEYTRWLQSVGFVDEEGNVKKATHNDMLGNVWKAWEQVPSELVKKSFQCAGLGLPMDGSQDEAIYSWDLQHEMQVFGLQARAKGRAKPVAAVLPAAAVQDGQDGAAAVQAGAADVEEVNEVDEGNEVNEDDDNESVEPPVEQVESDHEAAEDAERHLMELDARFARSLACNLRPRTHR
jgi:hypothetical protein